MKLHKREDVKIRNIRKGGGRGVRNKKNIEFVIIYTYKEK